MKKTAMLLLMLALCLLVAPLGLAESGPVARSDALAAYTDGNGQLFLTGKTAAINGKPADSVVGIDTYRALYLSPDDFLDTLDLYAIDLQSLQETLVARDVKAACLAGDDTAYYVTGANRSQLVRVDLHSLASQVAYTAAEPIDRLYMSAEGLIFQLVDQAATMLYVEETGRFELYSGDMPRSGAMNERYEVYLTDDAELYLKSRFNYATSLVDSDVTAFAWLNGTVYYLTRTGSALRLKSYNPEARTSKIVLTPGVKMKDQLTASGKGLFMLAADNTVCRVDIAQGTLAVFKRYSDLTAYRLPAEYNVDSLYIEGMSGQLNVYAQLVEKASKPTFSFIEFESETDIAAPVLRLIDTLKLSGEQTASDQLKPTPQYATLSRGSRGDAVSAIQQPLKDLGYYDYYVDGIYGPRTQTAVQLLQFDLDRPVTGVADAELQRIILSGRLSAYDPYHQLTRGDRGMRVRRMQERLRELGYLADAADGIFGPRTLKAVQLFQYENGLKEETSATRDTLRRLYSDSASRCSSYIDLYPGDTGYRVRELNNRLRDLYYLESSPGSNYTSQTTSAVRVFQRTAGLRETGNASQAVQRLLFSDDAPEAPGYIVLRRGDDNERVARLQRRLRELNYYDGPVDGYYGRQTKEAVALFQKKVGLKPTGVATVRTQQLLFDDDAPEYVKPTVIGEPDIYVENYDFEQDDIYFVSEDSAPNGYVIFSWDVEGSVDHYNVRVTDSRGNVFVESDTMMTSTGVSLATLDYEEIYTLRVRAYPKDGDRDHITQSEVDFSRLDLENDGEESDVISVGIPEIILSTVARIEGGVNYLLPGDITVSWSAEGDVDRYVVRIEDESGEVIVDRSLTSTEANISSSAMNAGEVYTITVSAIPEGGNMDIVRSSTTRFALPEVELPEPDPTPEPVSEPLEEVEEIDEIEDIEDIGDAEALELPQEDLELIPTLDSPVDEENGSDDAASLEAENAGLEAENAGPEAENAGPEAEPAAEALPSPEAIEIPGEEAEPNDSPDEEAEPNDSPDEEAASNDKPDEEAVSEDFADGGESIEVPEEPSEAYDSTQDLEVEAPGAVSDIIPEEADAQEGHQLGTPVITLDYVEQARDGVSYVSGEVLTMSWHAEGDVAQYRVALLDSNGNQLDSREVESESLSAHTSALDPDEVYTLSVTAIAAGNGADSPTASVRFALYAPASDDGYDEADDSANDEWQNAREEWQNAEEEYQKPEEEYEEPEEEYQEPEEEYQKPKEEYQEPEEEYQEPEDNYREPGEAYQEQDGMISAPEIEYPAADIGYPELQEEYQAPEIEIQDPWDEGEEYEDEEYEDEAANSGDGDGVDLSESEIKKLQAQLVALDWLLSDSYTSGMLDDATAYAISDFQRYCNSAFGMNLPMIDTSDPVIDAVTLSVLKAADTSYANPNAIGRTQSNDEAREADEEGDYDELEVEESAGPEDDYEESEDDYNALEIDVDETLG